MEQKLPFVTAMIVARNEEAYIKKAVLSLLNQEYPKNRLELLIIDGLSEDRTVEAAREAVHSYALKGTPVSVRYLKNPGRLLAAGWNIGIREARGEFVVRIDAHAQADPMLIRKCVKILLTRPDAACAGGRLETEALTERGRQIAEVLSSPFGVGDAKFRYAEKSGYVDTVAYGVYRKSVFEQAGYFNETFERNQDNDMHGRIKRCGGKFYLDASIKNIYHSRETTKGMMKQAWGNGQWIIKGMRESESREGISLRHLIPLFFVSGNLFLAFFGLFHRFFRRCFLLMYGFYFGAAVYFARKKAGKGSRILTMCRDYWLLHVSYGMGSLREIFRL